MGDGNVCHRHTAIRLLKVDGEWRIANEIFSSWSNRTDSRLFHRNCRNSRSSIQLRMKYASLLLSGDLDEFHRNIVGLIETVSRFLR